MVTLPREIVKAETQSPRKILIFGKPKIGKTSLIAGLQGNLNIDLEKGSSSLDMVRIEANSLEELIDVGKAIKAANEKEGKKIYNSISIDTISKFEDLAWQLATKNYKNTLIGKNFTGDSNALKQLPKGAGYVYLWEAFEKLYNFFGDLTNHLILIGHLTRTAISNKDSGEEIDAADINLTGKLKTIVCADMDAIGMLLRKGNQTVLSFKVSNSDLISGSRRDHLADKEIVVAEKNGSDFTYYWDRIFI